MLILHYRYIHVSFYCISTLYTVGIVYYTLGNLNPKLRSSLKSIHLLSIAKYEYIRRYGIEEVLRPVIEDVLRLEQVHVPLLYHLHEYSLN